MLYCDCGRIIVTADTDQSFQAEILMSCNMFVVIRIRDSSLGGFEDIFQTVKAGLLAIIDPDDRHHEDYEEGKRYHLRIRDGEGFEFDVFPCDCFYLETNAINEANKRNSEINAFYQELKNNLSDEAINDISEMLSTELYGGKNDQSRISSLFNSYGQIAVDYLSRRIEHYSAIHPPYWC